MKLRNCLQMKGLKKIKYKKEYKKLFLSLIDNNKEKD